MTGDILGELQIGDYIHDSEGYDWEVGNIAADSMDVISPHDGRVHHLVIKNGCIYDPDKKQFFSRLKSCRH